MKPLIIIFVWLLVIAVKSTGNRKPVMTFVTGLWNVGRDNLGSKFARSFDYYLAFYKELLQTDANLIAFGDEQLKQFTSKNRNKPNTVFIQKTLPDFEKIWYTAKIEGIINEVQKDSEWSFYKTLPQFGLKMYNPVVMSKLILLKQAYQKDIFNSDYFMWVDGGITHAIDMKILYTQVFEKITSYYQIDWFLQASDTFFFKPLEYGFKRQGDQYKIETDFKVLETPVWANWMGGRAEAISTVFSIYENFLRITFQNKDMCTDQSVFTLMLERYPYILTKLNHFQTKVYENFQAHIPSYHKIDQQRLFNVAQIVHPILYRSSVHEKPLMITKKTTEDVSAYQSLFKVHRNTLYFRLIMMGIITTVYLTLKTTYFQNQLKYYKGELVASEQQ